MKILYVTLMCSFLIGCGLSPEQLTATTIARQTLTQKALQTSAPSSTPLPNLTETQSANHAATQTMQVFNARVKLTEFAQPTTTALAKASIILSEIQSAVTQENIDGQDLPFEEAKLVFGPRDDRLIHSLYNIVIYDDTDLYLKNFIVSVRFINPYSTATTGKWDYGILFRDQYGNNQYRLVILSNQSWTLYNANTNEYIYSSNTKKLNAQAGEENTIWLIVIETRAFLFINGTYIKVLDVSANLSTGGVSPATGLYIGNLTEKQITEYKDFAVWSLP